MRIDRFSGLLIGLVFFVLLSLLAQSGQIHEVIGILGYFQNAALLFNFTSFLIPAFLSSVLFPSGGNPDLYMVLCFSLIQFCVTGYFLGKLFEIKK